MTLFPVRSGLNCSAAAKLFAEKLLCLPQLPSAAEAGTENEPVIAAVNRCAAQNQTQNRVFQQSLNFSPASGKNNRGNTVFLAQACALFEACGF
jgi:hypothetical protein